MNKTRRFYPTVVVLALVALLTLLAAPVRADVLNDINADTSNPVDWTAPARTTLFAYPNVTDIATAETFGAVLQENSTLYWTGSGAVATRILEYNAESFDPLLKGAIVGIDYSVEHDRPSSSYNSHPFRVALVQDGRYYSYYGGGEHRDNTSDGMFTMFSSSSALASDWHEVTSTVADEPTSNPDFSAGGSPITIALMTRHGSSQTGNQGFISQFKNFTVTFHTALNIDIKPGSDTNSINLCSNGNVPIAVLGSETFDVSNISTETLRFAEAAVKVVGKKDPHTLCDYEDADGDSYLDIVCHFVTADIAAIDGESTTATLNGELLDGTAFNGVDGVNIVKDTCN